MIYHWRYHMFAKTLSRAFCLHNGIVFHKEEL